MSLTPIFDAVLADSDPDIFLAGSVFPRPVSKDFAETWRDIGCPAAWTPAVVPDFTDWSAIRQPIWAAGGVA